MMFCPDILIFKIIMVVIMKYDFREFSSVILLVFTFLLVFSINAYASEKILYLNSYHENSDGSTPAISAFREKMLSIHGQSELYFEHFDSKRNTNSEYEPVLFKYLEAKYKNKKMDLIISADDFAYDFAEKYRYDIWGDTPLIFFGTNNFDKNRIKDLPNTVGIDEKPSFGDTLRLIEKLNPETEKIYVIHDSTITGMHNVDEFRKAIKDLNLNFEYEYLAGWSIEDMKRVLAAEGQKAAAVYFASKALDSRGVFYSSNEALKIISESSNVPIYGGWKFSLGNGIVGGCLIDLAQHGDMAAELSAKFLASDENVLTTKFYNSPNTYMFDYNQMKKFNISASSLPKESVIINEPEKIMTKTSLAVAGIFLIFSLTILVLGRLVEKFKRMLIKEKDKFEKMFRTHTAKMLIVDPENGRVVDYNTSARDFYGYTDEEMSKLNISDICMTDDSKHSRGPGISEKPLILKHRKKDGSISDVEILNAGFESNNSTYLFLIINDITQRISQQKKIKDYQTELEKLNETLEKRIEKEVSIRKKNEQILFEQKKFVDMGQMINAIAHQWRQPLNNVQLISQMLKEINSGVDYSMDYSELYEQQIDLLTHMSATIDDFSNFFSPKKEKSYFSITKEIMMATELVKPQLESSGIRVVFSCSCSEESITCTENFLDRYCGKGKDSVKGFPSELRQVYLNLISNAKDAVIDSYNEKITQEKLVNISIEVAENSVKITMCNTGGQIDDDVMPKIFDPYFTTKSEGKGTGIGLYMSKMIIEDSMKGKLSCFNTDTGVCFEIILTSEKAETSQTK